MRICTSADAKNNFGELIDLARAAPVAITKYDRPVVVLMAFEEYERVMAFAESKSPRPKKNERRVHEMIDSGKRLTSMDMRALRELGIPELLAASPASRR